MKTADTKARPDPISIRLPEELKANLVDAATSAGRSVNAEIRMRLEWSFHVGGFDGQPSEKMLAAEIESIRGEMRANNSTMRASVASLKKQVEYLERTGRRERDE